MSIAQQSPFACLFVWLLFKTQKSNEDREQRQIEQNEKREEKYQNVIDKNQTVIEEQAKAFASLSDDVHDIKKKLFEGNVA